MGEVKVRSHRMRCGVLRCVAVQRGTATQRSTSDVNNMRHILIYVAAKTTQHAAQHRMHYNATRPA